MGAPKQRPETSVPSRFLQVARGEAEKEVVGHDLISLLAPLQSATQACAAPLLYTYKGAPRDLKD